MRKDVERTYGILKGKWRILKNGICLHRVDVVDHIWKTCCALHNMLLHVDGYTELRNYDTSDIGCGVTIDDVNSIVHLAVTTTLDNVHDDFSRTSINDIYKLPMNLFCNKLIDHFDILFKQNKIGNIEVVQRYDNNKYRAIIINISMLL